MSNEKELREALLKVQQDMVEPTKAANNPHFKSKYVDLHALLELWRPILNKHNILLTQNVICDRNGPETTYMVRTQFMHTNGAAIFTDVPVMCDRTGSQPFGSALTYSKRQGLSMLLPTAGAEEDDDGEAAEGRGSRSANTSPKAKPFDNIEDAEAALASVHSKADLVSWASKVRASQFKGSDKDKAAKLWHDHPMNK